MLLNIHFENKYLNYSFHIYEKINNIIFSVTSVFVINICLNVYLVDTSIQCIH